VTEAVHAAAHGREATATRRTSGVVAAVVAVGSLLLLAGAATAHVAVREVTADWYGSVIWAAATAVVPVVGWVLVTRVPGNRYAWVWLVTGAWFALLALTGAAVDVGEALPTVGWGPYAALAGDYAWLALVGTAPLLLLWFPDGVAPSDRWRWVTRSLVAAVTVGVAVAWAPDGELGTAAVPNPLGRDGVLGAVAEVVVTGVVLVVFACFLAAFVSLLVRYRHGGTRERLQIRWVAVAAVVFSTSVVIDPPGVWDHLFEAATFGALPAAVMVAVLRYRLYDLDRLVSRTLAYAVVAALLVGVYAAGVLSIGALVRGLTGRTSSDLAVASATLAAAAIVQPLNRRVRATLDRRFDRPAYDARRTVERFGQRLRAEIDLDALCDELRDATSRSVSPASATVWLPPSS
jgi:hypothetical protein